MKSLLGILAIALFVCATVPSAVNGGTNTSERPTTLLVVRHADRQGSDDALSPAGLQRARDLAWVGGLAGVNAIYRSDTRRTMLTAEPLAKAAAITPVVYPARDVDQLIRRILDEHCGETVLVVGHSNTVPLIVAAAGGPASPDLPEDRYDDLFVVTIFRGKASVAHLRYGAGSN